MGKTTGISWTDHTFNCWIGCTKVSAGCDNCYAETLDRRWGGDHWGKGAPRKQMSEHYWNEPLRWNKAAQAAGVRRKVFCASMADVMDDEAPEGTRERLWALIDRTPNLVWQLLTKRPQRYMRYLPKRFVSRNVWLGVSAENQEFYNVRWPILRRVTRHFDCPSWISYEPALGPLSMEKWAAEQQGDEDYLDYYPDWIIFGGESGNGRRPMEIQWAEDLLRECRENASVTKFFMKQLGARTPTEGKNLIPASLLIHEFPRNA